MQVLARPSVNRLIAVFPFFIALNQEVSLPSAVPEFDLKRAVHPNRLVGLWRLMTGFRLQYIGATISLGISAIAKTCTYLLLRYFIDNFQNTQADVNLPLVALGFLGLGSQPPAPEWGAMISDGVPFLRTSPHMVFYPGMAIMLTVLGFNLLGDGLRDALDPQMRE